MNQSQNQNENENHNHNQNRGYLDSFLMKIPKLALCKIIFQKHINIPYPQLFKSVGQQLLTLIYSTSSTLAFLSNDLSKINPMISSNQSSSSLSVVDITQKIMLLSVKIFRKTLESNQIMHYFGPSQFRNSYWRPPRFHDIRFKQNKDDDIIDIKKLINNYHKFISESSIGYDINQYISKLLYPISNDKESMEISNRYLFSIIKIICIYLVLR